MVHGSHGSWVMGSAGHMGRGSKVRQVTWVMGSTGHVGCGSMVRRVTWVVGDYFRVALLLQVLTVDGPNGTRGRSAVSVAATVDSSLE